MGKRVSAKDFREKFMARLEKTLNGPQYNSVFTQAMHTCMYGTKRVHNLSLQETTESNRKFNVSYILTLDSENENKDKSEKYYEFGSAENDRQITGQIVRYELKFSFYETEYTAALKYSIDFWDAKGHLQSAFYIRPNVNLFYSDDIINYSDYYFQVIVIDIIRTIIADIENVSQIALRQSIKKHII